MRILVVNAGSSSVKLRVVEEGDAVGWSRDLAAPEPSALVATWRSVLTEALGDAEAATGPLGAAGHRVVHGGSRFTTPVRLDVGGGGPGADPLAALDALRDLAPLHNPPSLAGVHVLAELRPDLPQVACFDTAFHATMPAWAATYAVPGEWRRWGVRRFGFHGLSHAWASRRASDLLGRPRASLRLVTAHLGAGASLAAVSGGLSVDTTMGFTPLEGLVMATRSGSVDPGLVLWVQRRHGLSAREVEDQLEHASGLLGLSGTSGDLRDVLASADAGDPAAELAYGVYVHRVRTGVGSMVASLGGLDALVFTGGAGQASARLRRDVCDGLGFLGLGLDDSANRAAAGDAVLTAPGRAVHVVVVEAREELEVARAVRATLAPDPADPATGTPGG